MMPKICVGCGAVGTTCCEASKDRQKTANSLSRLVTRQSETITRLERELGEARQVASDLRAKVSA